MFSMNSETFNLNVFTKITKQICVFSFISVILIILFVISPLKNFNKTSIFIKIIISIIIAYTIYLNIIQTNSLRNAASSENVTDNIKSQLNINIICSYIFTIFLGMLGLFILKSFF